MKVVSAKFIVHSACDITYFITDIRDSTTVRSGNGARKKANTATAPSQSGTQARGREVSDASAILRADC